MMKKGVLILVLSLLSVSLVSAGVFSSLFGASRITGAPIVDQCSDSDNGNIYLLGVVRTPENKYVDFCVDEKTLLEYSCVDDEPDKREILCACKDGACTEKILEGTESTTGSESYSTTRLLKEITLRLDRIETRLSKVERRLAALENDEPGVVKPLLPRKELVCNDQIDNDGDKWPDCADSDCSGMSYCNLENAKIVCCIDGSNKQCYAEAYTGEDSCESNAMKMIPVFGSSSCQLVCKAYEMEYDFEREDLGEVESPEVVKKCGVNSFGVSDECEDGYFRYMKAECYDGETFSEGSESSCKSSEDWKSYAEDMCEGHCKKVVLEVPVPVKPAEKCGVADFGVSDECDKGYYRYMKVACYDGEAFSEGSESSCKSSEDWKSYAKDMCEGRCTSDEKLLLPFTSEPYLELGTEEKVPEDGLLDVEEVPKTECGDGFCDEGETKLSCPEDCLGEAYGSVVCGDGTCDEEFENAANCREDCGASGDTLRDKIRAWLSGL